jgi:hypothetical protein
MIDLEKWHLEPDTAFVVDVPNLRFWPADKAFDEKSSKESWRGFG